MSDSLDDFVKELQDQIFEETKAAYGDVCFNRWLNPLYSGVIESADGHGRVTGSCGDTMEIFLKFKGDKVEKASFHTDGCGSSTVCGSFAAEMALGKTPDELIEITGEKILDVLGGLPEEDRHCAFLAAASLQEAVNDHMIKKTGDSGKDFEVTAE
jgi:nitrogen fixation protein NifU and related proteins